MNKEDILGLIIKYDNSAKREKLKNISLEGLILIYIQVEIKIVNRKKNRNNI